MTYRRRRIRIQKYQGLAEPEHNSVKASPNPDTFHRLRRRPRSTLEQPSGNARFPVTESETISSEINLVIEKRVQEFGLQLDLDDSEQSTLKSELLSMTHRTYLWLHLVLEVISREIDFTKMKLKQIVRRLPDTVDKAYEAILSKS